MMILLSVLALFLSLWLYDVCMGYIIETAALQLGHRQVEEKRRVNLS